jgi:hypothetical protein
MLGHSQRAGVAYVYHQVLYSQILCSSHTVYLRESAYKSLVRPGRKQATATKLGIYSTYYTQSSIHFLARYSTLLLNRKITALYLNNVILGVVVFYVHQKLWSFPSTWHYQVLHTSICVRVFTFYVPFTLSHIFRYSFPSENKLQFYVNVRAIGRVLPLIS